MTTPLYDPCPHYTSMAPDIENSWQIRILKQSEKQATEILHSAAKENEALPCNPDGIQGCLPEVLRVNWMLNLCSEIYNMARNNYEEGFYACQVYTGNKFHVSSFGRLYETIKNVLSLYGFTVTVDMGKECNSEQGDTDLQYPIFQVSWNSKRSFRIMFPLEPSIEIEQEPDADRKFAMLPCYLWEQVGRRYVDLSHYEEQYSNAKCNFSTWGIDPEKRSYFQDPCVYAKHSVNFGNRFLKSPGSISSEEFS